MFFTVDLIQAQLQFGFGAQAVLACLVQGGVMRAWLVAQLQPFEVIGCVQQRRCGGAAGLLGSGEGVELLLQAL